MSAIFAIKIVIFGVGGYVWGLYYLKKWFPFSHVSESIGATLTSNRHWNEDFDYFPFTNASSAQFFNLPSLAAGHPGVVAFVYLRGMLAKEDVEQADHILNRLELCKRDDIANQHAGMAPDDPDDFVPDYEGRSNNADASGIAAPAPTREPAEEKKKPHFDELEDDGGEGFRPTKEDDGEGSRKTYPQEWHAMKRIAMRDLPTNFVVYRGDKRTYYISSGLQMRTMFAQLIGIRRRAIIEYMATSSLAADRVYVPREYQACIRHAIELFWQTQIATEAPSGWQTYLKLGSPGDAGRARRTYFKTWQHETFGKQWVFDMFVAFGDIDAAMIEAINESCDHRAKALRDPDFTPTVVLPLDPASTRDTTTLERLSARGRAAQMSFELPPVQGLVKIASEAAQMRQDAKEMEEEVLKFEQADRDEVERTGQGTDLQKDTWNERRGVADRAWAVAHRLSYDAGFDFTDRSGVRQFLSKESIAAKAVRTYLEKNAWPQVLRMKKQYRGRPPKRAGDKKGPQPKRTR